MDMTNQLVEYLKDNTQHNIETICSPIQKSSDGTIIEIETTKTAVSDDKQDWWKLIESCIILTLKKHNYILSAELATLHIDKKRYYAIIYRSVSLDIPLKDLSMVIKELTVTESDEIIEHSQAILAAGL